MSLYRLPSANLDFRIDRAKVRTLANRVRKVRSAICEMEDAGRVEGLRRLCEAELEERVKRSEGDLLSEVKARRAGAEDEEARRRLSWFRLGRGFVGRMERALLSSARDVEGVVSGGGTGCTGTADGLMVPADLSLVAVAKDWGSGELGDVEVSREESSRLTSIAPMALSEDLTPGELIDGKVSDEAFSDPTSITPMALSKDTVPGELSDGGAWVEDSPTHTTFTPSTLQNVTGPDFLRPRVPGETTPRSRKQRLESLTHKSGAVSKPEARMYIPHQPGRRREAAQVSTAESSAPAPSVPTGSLLTEARKRLQSRRIRLAFAKSIERRRQEAAAAATAGLEEQLLVDDGAGSPGGPSPQRFGTPAMGKHEPSALRSRIRKYRSSSEAMPVPVRVRKHESDGLRGKSGFTRPHRPLAQSRNEPHPSDPTLSLERHRVILAQVMRRRRMRVRRRERRDGVSHPTLTIMRLRSRGERTVGRLRMRREGEPMEPRVEYQRAREGRARWVEQVETRRGVWEGLRQAEKEREGIGSDAWLKRMGVGDLGDGGLEGGKVGEVEKRAEARRQRERDLLQESVMEYVAVVRRGGGKR